MEAAPHVDIARTGFENPVKCIFDSQGVQEFQHSVAIERLKYFLVKYAHMVNRQRIERGPCGIELVDRFVALLQGLSRLVDETPALPGPRRYGNLACRDWHQKLQSNLSNLWQELLPKEYHGAVPELNYYLGNSFGSSTRLDYGTGHELSFLAVVGALDMLGLWTSEFSGREVLLIFDTYYQLVRKLITAYTLEPAGSHGVWGLDDHFHIAYIYGSSQWSNDPNAPMLPRDITNRTMVEKFADTNLYCQAISFIYQVKSGPFAENSSMLYDIATTVHTWSKVHSGLLKMYYVEVLNKFPVIQHFWFGTGLYPWINAKTGQKLPIYESAETKNEMFAPSVATGVAAISMCHLPGHSIPHAKLAHGRYSPVRGMMAPPSTVPTNSCSKMRNSTRNERHD
ncbi:hypothetical protein HG536_0H02140 [Torulaspora globosa]|uniref:Serine/threonine-protein phosphatase 2A activator n=1 Tax=Torulaspora globosa TaxID=48254 RepID=A0A7G3ZMV3_9SACH|nr:uncharacterized protein HG536_0H02140 [Torulaspora globosa]QLL34839.1 hypothetical protein HG536_0H02140 [Torulaspora globosa]